MKPGTIGVGDMEAVFENVSLLSTEFIPSTERIVGQENQLALLDYAISPLLFDQPSDNILLRGPPGTGKSLCASYIAQREVGSLLDKGMSAIWVDIDCRRTRTESHLLRVIGHSVRQPENDLSIPERGLSKDEYRARLREYLSDNFDVIIVILNDVHVPRDEELSGLLRTLRGVDECLVGLLGIARDVRNGAPTIDTDQWDRKFTYDPYSCDILHEILRARLDAFTPGVVGDDVLDEVVDRASADRPNARRGIDLLRVTGMVVAADGAERAEPSHVEHATLHVDGAQTSDYLRGLSLHSILLLSSLATVTGLNDSNPRTSEIYCQYEVVCERRGVDSLSKRRVRDLLREHEYLGLTDRSTVKGGRGEGNYGVHELRLDPDQIIDIVEHRLD